MKICRFHKNRIGLVQDGEVVDVTSALDLLPQVRYPLPRYDPLIAHLDQLKEAFFEAAKTGERRLALELAFDSPIANPGKLVAAPVNYVKHLEEARAQKDLHQGNAAQVRVIHETGLFLKATSSLIGPSEPVTLRFPDRRSDHEIELAVVIGKRADRVSAERALEHVAGYAIGLDMTVRGAEERSMRKSIDSYSVLGPWLVTADEIVDPSQLDFELKVDGVTRQKANTRDLVLSVPELIEMASRFYTLEVGDVIFTGTPEGVGQVEPGNKIHAWIDRIGSMEIDVT
ncbi:2-keto-4-pentenoate hydratase/2-oxohepta-3-ene-1,7-dioic acid hydratase in catechol pathway [Rhizobium petrolearium]|jgi:2,4-didehydro-3-deoxy-L-rhamnonate hydrolase|uniref:Fumarylacetoacetate hydrolase family protein n=2 Tax=Neorhizobium TaxID=1525371 RepID=A0ABV0MDA7_9HYPH|nr:fumarylacetoacetate hydrolase family protein [Neorhizobium petrolearium]MBP1847297.1 2-keto-4-pentenoate hydratase/2-oxohepta-3-ene-1,7-dioic acid hydratase in catechol pathway [Neorhizobium petrolearium]MCC2614337.1 fumarylacetoacetate hydrolase family protein [Neorhizobium petrolearium]WGI72438.1 fumarylacetoacetate hydrolase family protein [Neorhizobium petrolearium]